MWAVWVYFWTAGELMLPGRKTQALKESEHTGEAGTSQNKTQTVS